MLLAHLSFAFCSSGDLIVRQGDIVGLKDLLWSFLAHCFRTLPQGTCMYIIAKGEAEIVNLDTDYVVGTMGPGTLFGRLLRTC